MFLREKSRTKDRGSVPNILRKVIHPEGTTEQHIIARHMSGLSGVSNYDPSLDFDGVKAANVATFKYGIMRLNRGAWEFDFSANPAIAVLSLGMLGSDYGTNISGGRAAINHLVVGTNCKTVITSYPQ